MPAAALLLPHICDTNDVVVMQTAVAADDQLDEEGAVEFVTVTCPEGVSPGQVRAQTQRLALLLLAVPSPVDAKGG